MVAHQIYLTERNEELVPSPKSELEEEPITTFEEDLRDNLKEWFKNIDFTATYRNLEEDLPEILKEQLMGLDFKATYCNIEGKEKPEYSKDFDIPNGSNEVDEVVREVEQMEKETVSEFQSFPATLLSHFVLPVEWSEQAGFTSMVAHHHHHHHHQHCQ